MNEPQPSSLAVPRPEPDTLPSDFQGRTRLRLVDPRENLHQRRLAGPIRPSQRAYLARLNDEVSSGQRGLSGKDLGQVPRIKDGGHPSNPSGHCMRNGIRSLEELDIGRSALSGDEAQLVSLKSASLT